MNTTKISSYGKLIAFFLVVLILLSTFAIAAGGWQIPETPDNGTLPNDGTSDGTQNDEPDNNINPPDIQNPELPKYYDYITGFEVTEAQSTAIQFAYVIDSNSPLCGIADCSLLMEFPTESGTRFLMLTNRAKDYSKIGSLAPTRNYISNLASVFGATLISLGKDDTVSYGSLPNVNEIDLLKNPGSYYTEYTYFSYTNQNLISPITNSSVQNSLVLPYNLADVNVHVTAGNIKAENISIPYINPTSLKYSAQNSRYTLIKSNSDKIDVSSQNGVSFDNVFILFADSMTYENASTTEMILHTLGSGEGYYAHNGTAQRISWILTEDGQMIFYDVNGSKLTINRGNSYISFVKSSKFNNVVFS